MPSLKENKELWGLIVAVVLGTAGAIWHFAPMDLAVANQERIAMISASAELAVWESRKGELEDDCLDRKNKVWNCGEEEREKWRRYYRHIQLLEVELGIEPIKEELP